MGSLGKVSNIDSKYIVISALVITSPALVLSPQDTSRPQLEIPLKEHTNRSQGGGGGRRGEVQKDKRGWIMINKKAPGLN